MTSTDALVWGLVFGLLVVSFGARASFILPGRRLTLSPTLARVLRFAPAAALMAIIVPDMARLDGVLSLSPANPRLVAGLVAFAVAIGTRHILLTMATGIIALWAWRAFLS